MKKKKKAPKKKAKPEKNSIDETLIQNSSPVCYVNSKELRDEYREEK